MIYFYFKIKKKVISMTKVIFGSVHALLHQLPPNHWHGNTANDHFLLTAPNPRISHLECTGSLWQEMGPIQVLSFAGIMYN